MLLDFCDIRIKNVHKFLVSLSYKHRLEKPNSIVKEKLEILNITLIFFHSFNYKHTTDEDNQHSWHSWDKKTNWQRDDLFINLSSDSSRSI